MNAYYVLGPTLCTFTHANLFKPWHNQPAREVSPSHFTNVETEDMAVYQYFLDFSVHTNHLGSR